MNKLRRFISALSLITIAAVALSACGGATQAPTAAAATPTEAATEVATTTEAPAASTLGTKDNPVIFVFVPSGDAAKILTAANAITDRLTATTGIYFKSEVPTSFIAAVEAMCAGKAQAGALNTFSYVLAKKKDCATVSLVSIRNGSPTYVGQIIANASAGIKTIADLKGKTFCRPDPVSTSGWIMPSLLLKANGVDPDKDLKEVLDAKGHDGVVKFVYEGKQCVAGGTFEDARTLVAKDLPDVNDKVVVIAKTDPIPNDTVAFTKDVPDDVTAKIVKGLEDMTKNDTDLATLKALYSWSGLQEVDDTFYDPFRQFLQAAGVDVETFVK